MSANLYEELEQACLAVRQRHLDRLRTAGVSIQTIADMGQNHAPFGVLRAVPMAAGYYQPGAGDSARKAGRCFVRKGNAG